MSGSAISVLVADDHAPTRLEVRMALEADRRFRVCGDVADAAAAVSEAMRLRPDICLLDVRMPGGGLAAAVELRARLPLTKLVMLTVSDADEDLRKALRAGVAGYLLKGMNLARLPHALYDVYFGKPAMPRELVGRLMDDLRDPLRLRRQVVVQHPGAQPLTAREWQILEMLAEGLSTKEIARVLTLSASAVRVHTSNIVKKVGARDRDEAIRRFRESTGD